MENMNISIQDMLSKVVDTENTSKMFNVEYISNGMEYDTLVSYAKSNTKPLFLLKDLIYMLSSSTNVRICNKEFIYSRGYFGYFINMTLNGRITEDKISFTIKEISNTLSKTNCNPKGIISTVTLNRDDLMLCNLILDVFTHTIYVIDIDSVIKSKTGSYNNVSMYSNVHNYLHANDLSNRILHPIKDDKYLERDLFFVALENENEKDNIDYILELDNK